MQYFIHRCFQLKIDQKLNLKISHFLSGWIWPCLGVYWSFLVCYMTSTIFLTYLIICIYYSYWIKMLCNCWSLGTFWDFLIFSDKNSNFKPFWGKLDHIGQEICTWSIITTGCEKIILVLLLVNNAKNLTQPLGYLRFLKLCGWSPILRSWPFIIKHKWWLT